MLIVGAGAVGCAIAKRVAEMVRAELHPEENPAFCGKRTGIVRFAEQTPERKAELIAQNPDYGEIICRCQQVTKQEIRQAIENPLGVKTISAIKYRAWPTTGRCQGGYCLNHIYVGLIPENEAAKCAGVQLDPRSNGTLTDAFLQTSVPGIFSCGNSHAVMDLVDFVSAQGEVAGQNAAAFRRGEEMKPWTLSRLSEPAKGLPDPDAINCILCPNGCRLRYEADGSISGAKCPRGEEYARQERTSPMRTLTLPLRPRRFADSGRHTIHSGGCECPLYYEKRREGLCLDSGSGNRWPKSTLDRGGADDTQSGHLAQPQITRPNTMEISSKWFGYHYSYSSPSHKSIKNLKNFCGTGTFIA